MSIKKFHEIFALEVAAINERRENKRLPIVLEREDQQRDGTPVMRPTPGSNVVGLALSGGGIRSSAFCLGAMQALDNRGLIDKIDYLSTVSGGGYIGTSMTAAMSTGTAGKFPFPSELRKSEVAGVQHIRDHSNYLFPQGLSGGHELLIQSLSYRSDRVLPGREAHCVGERGQVGQDLVSEQPRGTCDTVLSEERQEIRRFFKIIGGGDIEQIDVADVLSIYDDDRGSRQANQALFESRLQRLNEFWGNKRLADVTGKTCRAYMAHCGSVGGARRDLEDLRAAINHHAKEGYHRGTVRVVRAGACAKSRRSIAGRRKGKRSKRTSGRCVIWHVSF